MKILAGFEVKTGTPVHFDLHHLAAFGMTQKTGKTTLLEGCISRSGLRALAFRTKRGESGFLHSRLIQAYYKARSDWQWLEGLVNVALGEKVKYEPGMRGAIIRVSDSTGGDLSQILDKAKRLERDARRSFDRDLYHKLSTYLKSVVENMAKFKFTETLVLSDGVNVMDLSTMEQYPEIQQIVIAACLNLVHERMEKVIVVLPEAWEQIPQGKMTPVKWAAERFIRKGASIGNYLWLDSQDIGGIDKTPLRQVDNWFIGRMKEAHEVSRLIKQLLGAQIDPVEIQTMPLGHFFAAVGEKVKKIYALPVGVPATEAKQVATGNMAAEYIRDKYLNSEKIVEESAQALVAEDFYVRAQELSARLEELGS